MKKKTSELREKIGRIITKAQFDARAWDMPIDTVKESELVASKILKLCKEAGLEFIKGNNIHDSVAKGGD